MKSNKLKIINDPVHGFINIPSEQIYEIIQSPYVQRLRRIKQLGLSNLVYPSSEHTRFSHSIGAMYLMKQALDLLRSKGEDISDEEYSASLQAILLHDVGHSPFSHCLESFFFDVPHEKVSQKIMQTLKIDSMVEDIFTDNYKEKRFLHELVSSQVDTDRLDYLTRDSFFTGVSEGIIGTERILKMLAVHNGELVIEEKGIYSIEKFIISRRLMYWQVYMHKTVVGADCLLKNILKRAKFLAQNNALEQMDCHTNPHLFYFLKNGVRKLDDETALEHFVLLDDTDIWSSVKMWSLHNDKILSFLSKRLMNREIGKIEVKTSPFTKQEEDENVKKLFGRYNGKFSLQEIKDYFTSCNELHNRAYSFDDRQINILYKNGQIKEIYQASDQLDKDFLSKEIKKYYYYSLN
ncbi:MAG: HD domain-containing protein [Bacteroidales bacterium]|nr:HD domain-containing protein [Bacteroidales bacterium]